MKKIKKLISIVLLIFGICFIFPNIAFALDYENGHFEKIQTNLEIKGCPLKLKDGRILILDNNRNYIFNPKNNTFRETTPTPFGFSYVSNGDMFPAVVLNNGKVFIIGKILEPPFDKFKDELYEPIKAIFTRDEFRNNPKFASLSAEERNSIIVSRWKTFRKLPENEKEQVYLPIIRKNSDLLNRYNQYCQLREKSRRPLLFDPITETYEIIDNFIIDGDDVAFDFIPIIKSNNEILIFKSNARIQLYDLFNKSVTEINSPKDYKIIDIIPIDNNEILILLNQKKYCLYNMVTNTYSEIQSFPISIYQFPEIINFDNKNLLLFGNSDNQGIFIFNFIDKTYKNITNYAFERFVSPGLPIRPLLIENKIFIFGGLKNKFQPGILCTKHQISDKAEVINMLTNESKLKKMNYTHNGPRSIILNDGRILIYEGKNNELYIPKGYKK